LLDWQEASHLVKSTLQVNKEKFVSCNIIEIPNFGSIYTTRLYKLIHEFKKTGWMLKPVKQFREAFAVGDKF
jgi:plasmid replication initiation protein